MYEIGNLIQDAGWRRWPVPSKPLASALRLCSSAPGEPSHDDRNESRVVDRVRISRPSSVDDRLTIGAHQSALRACASGSGHDAIDLDGRDDSKRPDEMPVVLDVAFVCL